MKGTRPVKLRINGDEREFESAMSVAELLEKLEIRAGRVVVELNRDIVPREAHANTLLRDGDTLEIVHFVGGG